MVRADVIVMPGSRYLEFDMGRLEAMMRKQPTLRNAIAAATTTQAAVAYHGIAQEDQVVPSTRLVD